MGGLLCGALGGTGSRKYLIIALSAFLGTMLCYEYLVRRVTVLRVLFGMKLRRRVMSLDGRLPIASRPFDSTFR